MFFQWQEVLAVIEMLLVGHFSSKLRGFYPSEFPVLENLRRVILEPRSRSRLSSGPFISICNNPTKQKFQYFSPGTGCLFLLILYQTQLLPPAAEPRPLRPRIGLPPPSQPTHETLLCPPSQRAGPNLPSQLIQGTPACPRILRVEPPKPRPT